MNETAISWATRSWNPIQGCSHESAGCKFCYAETLSLKYGYSKKPWTKNNAMDNVKLKPHKLNEPYKLKGSQRVFVNSMSDAFHPLVPDDYIAQMFKVMNDLPQHVFQILTKRPERAANWSGPWGSHIWMGTSVEDMRVAHRIDSIRRCGADIRWLSVEPMLGPMPNLDLSELSWVVCGGESGLHLKDPKNASRWMQMEWARDLRDQCVAQGVPFFMKQSSALRTEVGCYIIEEDGSKWEWHQFPGEFTPPKRVGAEVVKLKLGEVAA